MDYSEEVAIRVAVIGVGEQVRQAAYGFGKLGTCSDCPTPEQFGEAVNMVSSHGLITKLHESAAQIAGVEGKGGTKRIIRGPPKGKDCFSCGTKTHSGKPASDTHMKDFCPAWGKTCEYCKGQNHYTKCCRKKKNDKKKQGKSGEVKAIETPEQELKRLRETVAATNQLALEDNSNTDGTNNSLTVRAGVANPNASGINYQGGGSQCAVLYSLEIVTPERADGGGNVTTHVKMRAEGHEGGTPPSNSATVKAIEGEANLKGGVGKKVPHQHYCKETGQWKLGVVPHPQLQLKVRIADDNFIPNNERATWRQRHGRETVWQCAQPAGLVPTSISNETEGVDWQSNNDYYQGHIQTPHYPQQPLRRVGERIIYIGKIGINRFHIMSLRRDKRHNQRHRKSELLRPTVDWRSFDLPIHGGRRNDEILPTRIRTQRNSVG